MTVMCAVCHSETPLIEHRFYEGDPRRPSRVWTLLRALYFLGPLNFCSPRCVGSYHAAEKIRMGVR
jgi:hypothetical protein